MQVPLLVSVWHPSGNLLGHYRDGEKAEAILTEIRAVMGFNATSLQQHNIKFLTGNVMAGDYVIGIGIPDLERGMRNFHVQKKRVV